MSAAVVKGIWGFTSNVTKNPKTREAIGKGLNALKGVFSQDEQKDNEDETTQNANEDQAKQNEQATDKTLESPTPEKEPEKEPDEEKSTKFREANQIQKEEREAINENPQKAEGLSLGNQDKMENVKNIIENKDDYSLNNKLESIREEGVESQSKNWQDDFQGGNKDYLKEILEEGKNTGEGQKSAVERLLEERAGATKDVPEIQNPTPDTKLNSMESVNPAQTQPNESIEIKNDVNNAPNSPNEIPDDRSGNTGYNPSEPNEFTMLDNKESSFFSSQSPTVVLSNLNDNDMGRFSNLAMDKSYSYQHDNESNLDNSNQFDDRDNSESNESFNELANMSFYGDDNGRDGMDDMDMDMDADGDD